MLTHRKLSSPTASPEPSTAPAHSRGAQPSSGSDVFISFFGVVSRFYLIFFLQFPGARSITGKSLPTVVCLFDYAALRFFIRTDGLPVSISNAILNRVLITLAELRE